MRMTKNVEDGGHMIRCGDVTHDVVLLVFNYLHVVVFLMVSLFGTWYYWKRNSQNIISTDYPLLKMHLTPKTYKCNSWITFSARIKSWKELL